jgi:hypothetical protein
MTFESFLSRGPSAIPSVISATQLYLNDAKIPPFGKGGKGGIFLESPCQKSPPPPFNVGNIFALVESIWQSWSLSGGCLLVKEVRLPKKFSARNPTGHKKTRARTTCPGFGIFFQPLRPLRPLSFLPQWKTCPRLPRAGRPPCPPYRRRPGWGSRKPCIPGRGLGSCKHLK